ncbi:MAG TPA: antibiotic biosynthesis monooxygenase family protein [Mycobacteriales bacterium]|jgi:heme-degrading monooxygenase HmoA|nr:antibiotic biosynthesis monooxygenase family protein [Mycobacteriales bacterium]
MANHPVTEHALLFVRPGQEADFEVAMSQARQVLGASPGCRSVRVLRGEESPSTYLLLVDWDSRAAHTDTFRNSAAFTRWRELVGRFWEPMPTVEHFRELD